MTWVNARLDFNNIKLDETMKAITVDELHRIWLPIITLSWVTPEFGPSTLQWQNANSGVCQAGNPAQTLMHETNMIETFHKSWSEKMLPALLASLQLSTKLELQFGRPDDFQPGFAAAGHPAGAPYRCRPRSPQGPASKEWSSGQDGGG